MKKLLLILLAICYTSLIFAQNLKQEVIEVYGKMSKANNLTYNMVVNFYPTYTSTILHESEVRVFVKKGENSFYTEGKTEVMTNKNYTVAVNNDQKILMIVKAQHKRSKIFTVSNIDSILSNKYADSLFSFTKLPESDNIKGIHIKFNYHTKFTAYDLFYNSKTKDITKMTLYFSNEIPVLGEGKNDKPRIELIYKNIVYNPEIDLSLFRTKNYVTVIADVISPVAKYKDYELLNGIR